MSQAPLWLFRSAQACDLQEVISFVQGPEELFFCYPKGQWPLTVGQLAATMAQRRDNSVALMDGRMVGFANLQQWHYGDYCELGNLMVAPSARNQEAAQHLIEWMEHSAQQHYQAKSFHVSCFNGNTAGLLLLNKLGYQLCGISPEDNPQGQRVALLKFTKKLPPSESGVASGSLIVG